MRNLVVATLALALLAAPALAQSTGSGPSGSSGSSGSTGGTVGSGTMTAPSTQRGATDSGNATGSMAQREQECRAKTSTADRDACLRDLQTNQRSGSTT